MARKAALVGDRSMALHGLREHRRLRRRSVVGIFNDGGVGMCGRDDKWLGFTADAISQVAMLKDQLPAGHSALAELLQGANRASSYIDNQVSAAKLDDHG